MYVRDFQEVPDAYGIESLTPGINLSDRLFSYLDAPSPRPNVKGSVWVCPHDTLNYLTTGGSYNYMPYTYRINYTITPIMILENTPLIGMIQDRTPRNDKLDLGRYDGSALEINQRTYNPGATWLAAYRRNP